MGLLLLHAGCPPWTKPGLGSLGKAGLKCWCSAEMSVFSPGLRNTWAVPRWDSVLLGHCKVPLGSHSLGFRSALYIRSIYHQNLFQQRSVQNCWKRLARGGTAPGAHHCIQRDDPYPDPTSVLWTLKLFQTSSPSFLIFPFFLEHLAFLQSCALHHSVLPVEVGVCLGKQSQVPAVCPYVLFASEMLPPFPVIKTLRSSLLSFQRCTWEGRCWCAYWYIIRLCYLQQILEDETWYLKNLPRTWHFIKYLHILKRSRG